jgi:hypothetical protein
MNSIKQKTPSIAAVALAVGFAVGAGVHSVASAADGSVIYNNGGDKTAEAAGFFWDDVNNLADLRGNRLTFSSLDQSGIATGQTSHPGPGVWLDPNGDARGRVNLGYGPRGGANMEMYSKGDNERPGQFNYTFGGAPGLGRVTFSHYDGTQRSDKMALYPNGNLYVAGTVNSSEILVQVQNSTGWPDYVFEDNYPLMPLEDLDQFIQTNGHLPGVVTQAEVKEKGVNVGEVSAQLLKKVEELTLYVIDLKKQNDDLSAKVAQLEGQKAD